MRITMRLFTSPILAAALFAASALQSLAEAEPSPVFAKMPINEITVFKDGHAFVLHEGRLPTDARGNVVMDYLPAPVLGTFWPYSTDRAARLTAVTAGSREVTVDKTALSLPELLTANPGAKVRIIEVNNQSYSATIIGVPERKNDDTLNPSLPPQPVSPIRAIVRGSIVLLKTETGIAAVPMDRIVTVTFEGPIKSDLSLQQEDRNVLTMKLDWAGGNAAKEANVGMLYLQKGIRWIPGYKVTIDGKGNAVVKLQGTLINEMADLTDVTTNLVIGVPNFAFRDTADPIGLQQTLAQLSPYFQRDARTGNAFSNSIMSQARFGERAAGAYGPGGGGAGGVGADIGPEVAGTGKAEDLFVFTVKHITLKKGERMVVPITEYALKYKDVYTLDVPFGPPPELRGNGNINTEQQAEMARLLSAPKVMHKIRLTNKTNQPLTTAPALILNGERVVAQGLMTYTPVGSDGDLSMTTAVDIGVTKTEKETGRTPNAVQFQGNQYARIDLSGVLCLTNYRATPVTVEVRRYVLGKADTADHNGEITALNAMEETGFSSGGDTPMWWSWYSWPYWWHHLNSVGKISWKVDLPPGKPVELGYKWHYFWQ
jgi:hypothetical protein